MPVKTVWDNDAKTIVRNIYSGNVTVDDYYIATDEFVELAVTVDHQVNSIMDRTNIVTAPATVLQALRYADKKIPEGKLGMSVIVNSSTFSKVMVNIGKRFAPNLAKTVFFADTVEDAHHIIAEQSAISQSE